MFYSKKYKIFKWKRGRIKDILMKSDHHSVTIGNILSYIFLRMNRLNVRSYFRDYGGGGNQYKVLFDQLSRGCNNVGFSHFFNFNLIFFMPA